MKSDVRDATHVQIRGTWKRIVAKYGIDADGRLAKPSAGGFGVLTEDGEMVDMWHAEAYARLEGIIRPATIDEQFDAIVTTARRLVRDDRATHDCGEWVDEAGRCQLCDRVLEDRVAPECTCRTRGCGHRASDHFAGACRLCRRGVCWS